MADALGLAVNIIAVIEVAKNVALATYTYAHAYKHAPKDLKSLQDELCALVMVLELLKDHGSEEKQSALGAQGGPLWLCDEVLRDLKKVADIDKGKMKGARRVMWPFKDGQIREHLTKLERAKSILQLSLSADQSTLSTEIERMCKENLLAVRSIDMKQDLIIETVKQFEDRQISTEQQASLKWLHNGVDFETNHKEARKLHHPHTGDWFVNAGDKGDFVRWLKGYHRHIWLHGIPGAGKTVLMSTIISTATEQLKLQGVAGIAYFYFSFREEPKQLAVNMLSSILSQLSHQAAEFPESVTHMHQKYKTQEGRPDCAELLGMIVETAQIFPRVHIFLDALDESNTEEQGDLFTALSELCAVEKICTIITSRKEGRIEQELKELDYRCISIQTEAVNHDIKVYVEALLEKDVGLRRQNARLKGKILDTLASGAHGMFRWVECQLDVLRHCKVPSQIVVALDSLPKTLYETYDRTLEKTPEQDRNFLKRALAWIIYAGKRITVEELAEAMIVEPGSERLGEYDRVADLNPSDPSYFEDITSFVESICGSFIRLGDRAVSPLENSDGKRYQTVSVVMAHYSVQEYLTSEYLAKGKLSWWSLTHKEGKKIVLDACLTYMQWEDFEVEANMSLRTLKKTLKRLQSNFPGFDYCLRRWTSHIQPEDEEDILARAHKLLRPMPYGETRSLYATMGRVEELHAGPLYHMSKLGQAGIVRRLIARGDPMDDGESSPLIAATVNNNAEVIQVLVDDGGADLFKPWGSIEFLGQLQIFLFQLPIHYAVLNKRVDALRFILDRSPDIDVENERGSTPLGIAVSASGNMAALELLVKQGANPSRALIEAMEVGQRRKEMKRLNWLLENGADVNYCDKSGASILRRWFKFIHNDRSIYNADIISLLVEHGAEDPTVSRLDIAMTIYDQTGDHAHEISILEILDSDPPPDITARTVNNSTPFERAVRSGWSAAVKKMLEPRFGIDVDNYRSVEEGWPPPGTMPPLHLSIAVKQYSCTEVIFDAGARVRLNTSVVQSMLRACDGTYAGEQMPNFLWKKLLERGISEIQHVEGLQLEKELFTIVEAFLANCKVPSGWDEARQRQVLDPFRDQSVPSEELVKRLKRAVMALFKDRIKNKHFIWLPHLHEVLHSKQVLGADSNQLEITDLFSGQGNSDEQDLIIL